MNRYRPPNSPQKYANFNVSKNIALPKINPFLRRAREGQKCICTKRPRTISIDPLRYNVSQIPIFRSSSFFFFGNCFLLFRPFFGGFVSESSFKIETKGNAGRAAPKKGNPKNYTFKFARPALLKNISRQPRARPRPHGRRGKKIMHVTRRTKKERHE